jgi:uracil-DNA glycosylase family 4
VATDKVDFLKKLKSLLVYHEAIGIRHYPRTEEVESFCGRQVTSPPSSSKNNNSPSLPTKGKTVKAKLETTKENREVILSGISIEVAACTACELHKHRIYPVPGRGGEGARLLIVGDWLSGDDDGNLAKDLILGGDQDQMLARMLAAIKLLSDEVFITNVIKCAVPGSCYPAADHVRCCMSFLRRQIAVLAPEVICVMGMVAAKAVLDRPKPLSQLRGTFHTYETEDGLHIPVLATYHPTNLLQNPEMKKATWADLQLLAKKLRLPTS